MVPNAEYRRRSEARTSRPREFLRTLKRVSKITGREAGMFLLPIASATLAVEGMLQSEHLTRIQDKVVNVVDVVALLGAYIYLRGRERSRRRAVEGTVGDLTRQLAVSEELQELAFGALNGDEWARMVVDSSSEYQDFRKHTAKIRIILDEGIGREE